MRSIKFATVIAVATVFSTGAFAADSLAGALSEGKVSGHLKSYYFTKGYKDYDSTKTGRDTDAASLWTQGADLTYKTGSWGGINAVVTGQFAVVTHTSDDTKYGKDMDGSGFVLSQAYLQYSIKDKGFIRGGRQYISTPIVKGSGSRMIKQSFSGIVGAITAVPNNVIVGGYVTEYQNRTDNAGGVGKFDTIKFKYNLGAQKFDTDLVNGASTVYLKNTSIKNLTVQAQVASLQFDTDQNITNGIQASIATSTYTDAKYKFGPAYAAVQYINTGLNGKHLNHLAGVKVGGKFGPVNAYVAYTQTGDVDNNASVWSGLGSGATRSNFTANTLESTGSAYKDDSTAMAVHVGVNMKKQGIKAFVRYTDVDSEGSKTENDLNDIDLMASYAINKKWNIRVDHAILDWGKGTKVKNNSRSRVKLTYKF